MNRHYNLVTEFMTTAGQSVLTTPTLGTAKLGLLRIGLIEEEVSELKEALETDDMIEVIDALGDILVVAYGAIATYGGNMNPLNSVPLSVDRPILRSFGYSMDLIRMLENSTVVFSDALINDNLEVANTALKNMIETVYNGCTVMGIDIDKVIDIIHESNMSKFCKTVDDAEKSISDLVISGKVETESELTYTSISDYYVITRVSDGKIMKGRFFHEPDFSIIL